VSDSILYIKHVEI